MVVLGLAGAALGVDRFVLSGEATAPSKASADTPVAQAVSSERAQAPAPVSGNAVESLASRMHALASQDTHDDGELPEVRDAFVPEWQPTIVQSPHVETPAPAANDSTRWLRLTSVVPGRAAVINGTVVFLNVAHDVPADPTERAARLGDQEHRRSMRTITLLKAEERRAVVKYGEDEVELALPDRGDKRSSRRGVEASSEEAPDASGR